MKYLLLILSMAFINCKAQTGFIQVCDMNTNGRYTEGRYVFELKKDFAVFVSDTVYMDSLRWPNNAGKIIRQTIYVDPRSFVKHKPDTQIVYLGNDTLMVVPSYEDYGVPTNIKHFHKKGHHKKRYRKPAKARIKKVYSTGTDSVVYYDLYFTGSGKVFTRGDGIVGLQNAKGKFYRKRAK